MTYVKQEPGPRDVSINGKRRERSRQKGLRNERPLSQPG